MKTIPLEVFRRLQNKPSQIRNLCILAHVDHGKTSLADSLVAANGIISARMAGRLRYMDSRPDEQERGITMKSSAISLYYKCDESEYVINLIDSPGHIDFCGEVSTAIRLCDGAFIIVDAVEGVCPQTNAVLRQACKEGLQSVLVINKMDRLITELKMTPLEAYKHIEMVIQQVNSIAGEILLSTVIENEQAVEADFENLDLQEERMYFSPERGNVVFASALDTWGFQVCDFARLLSAKYGIKESLLNETLWGDFYLETKSKRIKPGAADKGKKPLFVQMVLDNLWTVYQAVVIDRDEAKIKKVVDSLQISISARDQRHRDPKIHLQAILGQWLPVAGAMLNAACRHLPAPNAIQKERANKLMSTTELNSVALFTAVRDSISSCANANDDLTVVFVSKMCAVERKNLPSNRKGPLTAEEIQNRRTEALEKQKVRFDDSSNEKVTYSEAEPVHPAPEQSDFVFLGFARVFSGKLCKGQTVYILPPNYTPHNNDTKVTQIEVGQLYLFMGRELEEVDEVPAGNLVGVGGLEEHILKCGTLSSSLDCPPLTPLQSYAQPIVRVSIEPAHPSQMSALVKGLKLLNQADPCVRTYVQATGEHVLVTAGEVHLERCISDLKERFSTQVDELIVSEPIIPFLETIVFQPKIDAVNELILGQTTEKEQLSDLVELSTSNKQTVIQMRAIPLPAEIIQVLEKNEQLLSTLECLVTSWTHEAAFVKEETKAKLRELRKQLLNAFELVWKRHRGDSSSFWGTLDLGDTLSLVQQIWSFGTRKAKSNILFSRMQQYSQQTSIWRCIDSVDSMAENTVSPEWQRSVLTGFHLTCSSGPLCEEPMYGVGFVIEECVCDKETSGAAMAGQMIALAKETCKQSFQRQPQRLMIAMYSCTIQATTDVLGKVYAVLSKRGGRVLSEEMNEGTNLFQISAVLPVVESFGFSHEIRKRTSGLASPQLVFSHWEVLDVDPFWVPTTEEELLHFGEKADADNQARLYMNAVRKRKGLTVDEKIVEFAEKQRTLTKMK